MSKPKTIKVRIAVVVAGDGTWNSGGWYNAEDGEKMGMALEGFEGTDGELRFWLEAELPLPEIQTITVVPVVASVA